MDSRKKLLNYIQELRGNIRVYCRPRPPRIARGELRVLGVPDASQRPAQASMSEGEGKVGLGGGRCTVGT